MANNMKSARAAFNFLVSEANDWRSRDEYEIDNSEGDEALVVGTILSGDDPSVAWGGTGDPSGILCQSVPAGEIVRRTVITSDAEVVGADLEPGLPEGVEIADAADALRGLGIIVRVNKGLKVGVTNPAPAADGGV